MAALYAMNASSYFLLYSNSTAIFTWREASMAYCISWWSSILLYPGVFGGVKYILPSMNGILSRVVVILNESESLEEAWEFIDVDEFSFLIFVCESRYESFWKSQRYSHPFLLIITSMNTISQNYMLVQTSFFTCRDNAKLLPTESVSLFDFSSSELFVVVIHNSESSGKFRSALIKLMLLLRCSLGVWLV